MHVAMSRITSADSLHTFLTFKSKYICKERLQEGEHYCQLIQYQPC